MASVLHLIIIPPFLAVVCYMFGSILSIKSRKNTGERMILGLIGILALFQFVALPFMYFETCFTPLYILCICFLVLIIAMYILLVIKRKISFALKEELLIGYKNKTKEKMLLWLFIIILVALHVFNIMYFQRSDPDDAYYLAQTNTVLDTNYLMNIEPSTGLDNFTQMITYKLVGHEVLLAVIAKLFCVNVAFLCHMVLPVFMVPLHYVIVYTLGKEIKVSYKEIFVILCTFVNLFACFSGASASAFLSYRIWQGKAVLASVILPVLLLEFWKIYKKRSVSNHVLLVLILLLWAGFCTTTVGLYLIPIAYFAYTATYFLTYRDIKNSFRLCIPIVFCIPFVIVKFVSLLSVNYFGESNDFTTTYWTSLFSKYLKGLQTSQPNYIMAIFFLIAIIYIWKKGNKIEKMISVYAPGVLFLTFANPLFFPIISKYITGKEVYWRIFWLPQFRYIVIIAMLIYISENLVRKFMSTLVMILLISGSGDYVFKEPRYTERENRYKISDEVVWVSDEIITENDEDNNYLLIPDDFSYEVRQYTGKVRLVWGRYAHVFYSERDFKLLQNLYEQLYDEKKWNDDVIEKRMQYFHVNYVFLYNDSLKSNEIPDSFEKVFQKSNFTLFKIVNS